MRLSRYVQTSALVGALAFSAALCGPAMAEESAEMPFPGMELPSVETTAAAPVFAANDIPPLPAAVAPAGVDTRPVWNAPAAAAHAPRAAAGPTPEARAAWLSECRRRMSGSYRDDGVGGAVVGGLLGGLFGNRIAGRHHRTTGTVIGAVGGAVAGAVIDRAEDGGRNSRRGYDYCEAYLDDYYANAAAYGWQGHQAHAMRMVMVPAGQHMMHAAASGQGECTETVTTTEYEEDAPVARRYVPSRRISAPPPRRRVIRRVPDKRIPL